MNEHYGYLGAQVLRNTLASGMSPRQSEAFFTSIGFTPMGGSWRKHKTRKGNTASRLATVSKLLPTPRRNGFSVSARSKTMAHATSARTRKPKQETTTPDDLAELGKVTFDSVLTDQQVEEFESAQTEWGPKRRCALITLARTRQQLVDGFGSGEGPDVLLEMIGHVSDYEKHCKALAEMAATAVARLMAVAAATIEKGATA